MFRSPDGHWNYATQDQACDPDDIEGARESGRRKSRHVKGVKRLDAQAGDYDPLGAVREMAAKNRPAPLTALPDRLVGDGAVIELAAGALAARRELAALPSPTADADRRRAEEDEYLERKWSNAF